MAILQDILYKVSIRSVHGNTQAEVGGLQIDSRQVKKDDAFIAIKGSAYDGHKFIDKAIEQGALVIICEQFPAELADHVTYVQVADSGYAAGYMAHNFY